jgi:hypothetical protein
MRLSAGADEKCRLKHMAVFHPGSDGRSHVSGMTCRDPNTVQGKHQQAMRLGCLRMFGLPMDGPDMAFWSVCGEFERKLADGLRHLAPKPRYENVTRLFLARWPEGLNKWGLKPHPDSGLVGYTLQTHVILFREGVYYRWQRSEDGRRFPSEPEVYRAADLRPRPSGCRP